MGRFGGVEFLVVDAQQQRRTPVIGHYYEKAEKQRTRLKHQKRKCSRRMWKAMNRKQFNRIAIYDEPKDVLSFGGKYIVTPRQKQALELEIKRASLTQEKQT